MASSVRLYCAAFLLTAALVGPAPLGAQGLDFPADEGAHEDSDFELWSVLAHLEADSGRNLGIVAFFFTGKVSGLKLSGTYHLVADEASRTWSSARDLVVPVFGKSSRARGRLDIRFDRSRLIGDTTTNVITSSIRTGDTDLELVFEPRGEVTDFGYLGVGQEARQRIYARATGSVRGSFREGDVVEEVTGTGLFQHAWGDSPDPGSTGSIFSVHLDDGSALVGYHGTAESAPHALSLSEPGSEPRVLKGFVAEPAGEEGSGGGEVAYDVRWRLRTEAGGVDLRLDTTSGGQAVEILGQPYWVGRCRVRGTIEGRPVSGVAYVVVRGDPPVSGEE